MPPDSEIFQMREKDKAERRQAHARAQQMPVADKSTFASRMAATVPARAPVVAAGRPPARAAGALRAGAAATLAAAAVAPPVARRQRERVGDFIAKKREIFLVQMALDVKRTEIRKLEERILQRCDLPGPCAGLLSCECPIVVSCCGLLLRLDCHSNVRPPALNVRRTRVHLGNIPSCAGRMR